jgi:hypothetical protein
MEIKPGLYKHFKGKLYRVIGVFKHSETMEDLVVYQGLYHSTDYGEHPRWARPVPMFFEQVDRDSYHGSRFQFLNQDGPFTCGDCGVDLSA